jgi:hypothetical protein
MATDRAIWKQLEQGVKGSGAFSAVTVPASMVKTVHQRHMTVLLPVDASAADDAAKTIPVCVFDRAVQIISARVTCAATVATQASVFSTLTLTADDDTPASTVTVAAITNTAAFAANASRAMTLTATNCVLAANAALRLTRTHASTGTILPVATLDIVYEEI